MKPLSDRVAADHSRRSSGGDAALLASIVDSSNDAIVSNTLDGVITSWNQAAEELYGTAEETIGESISLLTPQGTGEMDEILGKIRAGKRVDHYQTARLRKDGSMIPISLTVSPNMTRTVRSSARPRSRGTSPS